MSETTPTEITEAITRFCTKLAPGAEPVWVPVQPRPEAQPSVCFYNVQRTVEQSQGSMQCGWLIWEWSGVLLNAEFHAVWQAPTGLVDVTPLVDGEQTILFLPTNTKPRRTNDGSYLPIAAQRYALSQNSRKFVKAHNAFDRLRARMASPGPKLGQIIFDPAMLPHQEQQEFQRVVRTLGRTSPF